MFSTAPISHSRIRHLNMVLGLSTDPVLVGPHHARAELVENLKGRLVARKTKLPLKLHGGHAGRLTGDQISGPEPDVQRSVATLHHCSHRQPGVSGGTCGSAGRQGGFQSGPALPPCRSAGRQSRLPSGLSPGRRRRPHHRGKVAGTRVANAGMGDRRGREHPWRAPLYPVCAHSSPSGCGYKPDRQGFFLLSGLLRRLCRAGSLATRDGSGRSRSGHAGRGAEAEVSSPEDPGRRLSPEAAVRVRRTARAAPPDRYCHPSSRSAIEAAASVESASVPRRSTAPCVPRRSTAPCRAAA